MNGVFRAERYAAAQPALAGRELVAQGLLEITVPSTSTHRHACCTPSPPARLTYANGNYFVEVNDLLGMLTGFGCTGGRRKATSTATNPWVHRHLRPAGALGHHRLSSCPSLEPWRDWRAPLRVPARREPQRLRSLDLRVTNHNDRHRQRHLRRGARRTVGICRRELGTDDKQRIVPSSGPRMRH